MFAKIAFLNIVKHAHRSIIVFVAVLLAVMVLALVGSFVQGIKTTFLDSILPTSGHIQIKSKNNKNAINPMDLKYLLDDSDKIVEIIQDSRILVKEKILSFPALLVQIVPIDTKKDAKNLGMIGQGVLPQTDFIQNIRKGIVQGDFLPNGEGICLSVRAAQLLDAKLGDGIMVLTQDRGNNSWYQELTITGLFDSGNTQVNGNFFAISHKIAETLLDAEHMTREIRLLLNDPQEAPLVSQALAPVLEAKGLRAETWQENFGSFLTIIKFFDIISLMIRTFFIIVAASVITNSILMTIFERTREYATLRALGLKRLELFGLILIEGGFIGTFGSIAGLAIGVPLILLLSQVGVDMGSMTEYLGFDRLFYPVLALEDCFLTFFCGILMALLASLYAAVVSTRLTITQALTHL